LERRIVCTPSIPKPPPPPQEVKTPDAGALKDSMRKNRGGMAGGTVLTGPSGITAPVATGRSTLLGQ
jgi:hypothetical protein